MWQAKGSSTAACECPNERGPACGLEERYSKNPKCMPNKALCCAKLSGDGEWGIPKRGNRDKGQNTCQLLKEGSRCNAKSFASNMPTKNGEHYCCQKEQGPEKKNKKNKKTDSKKKRGAVTYKVVEGEFTCTRIMDAQIQLTSSLAFAIFISAFKVSHKNRKQHV